MLDRQPNEVTGDVDGRHLDDGEVPAEVASDPDRLLDVLRRVAPQAVGVGADGATALGQRDADRGAVDASREQERDGVVAASRLDGVAQQLKKLTHRTLGVLCQVRQRQPSRRSSRTGAGSARHRDRAAPQARARRHRQTNPQEG